MADCERGEPSSPKDFFADPWEPLATTVVAFEGKGGSPMKPLMIAVLAASGLTSACMATDDKVYFPAQADLQAEARAPKPFFRPDPVNQSVQIAGTRITPPTTSSH